jgi:Zn-dependent protease
VRNITLFLLGGVANIEREPPTPKTEFLVAAAGPAVSLLIGGAMTAVAAGSLAFGGSSGAGSMTSQLSPASTLLFWLGSINIILAIFNMIPGFPLDGGRVLRSILWAVTKNLRLATRLASWIGQAIAWIMIIAGMTMAFGVQLPLLGTGMMSGLWLVFIGWFLNNASSQSYQQVALQDILERVPVERLMKTDLPTVEPGWLISDFIRTHGGNNQEQSAFPVLHDNTLVGMVTLEDTGRVPRERWHAISISQIMTPTPRLVTVSPEEDAASAMEKLIQRDVRQLAVVCPDFEFLGLLRRRDILQWLQSRLPARRNRFTTPPPSERR